jgi:hypothetical protein
LSQVQKFKLRQSVANSVLSEIQSKRGRYYFYLGKIIDFSDVNEVPLATLEYENQVRSEMVLLKSISSADVSFVIPRVSWTSGTIYYGYDVKSDGSQQNNYALDEASFNVYKCIDNKYGTGSLILPSGTDIDIIATGDGYKWKFMYNIPLSLRNKFLTSTVMPVQTALTARFFSNGSIDTVSVVSSGAGYTQQSASIVVSGNGRGAELYPIIVAGQVVDVRIDNPGSGYDFFNIEVFPTQTTGNRAVVTASVSAGDTNIAAAVVEMLSIPGTIDSIKVSNPGSGYTTATVTIAGSGAGCTATAEIIHGSVAYINIVTSGSNYGSALVTVTGDGSGASAYANVSPALGHGRNAVGELAASDLLFYGTLVQESVGGISIDSNYRQYGIIKNPMNLKSGSNMIDPASASTYAVSGNFLISDYPIGTIIVDGLGHSYTVDSVFRSQIKSGMILRAAGIPYEISTGTVLSKLIGIGSFTAQTAYNNEFAIFSTITTCYSVSCVYSDSDVIVDSILTKGNSQYRIVSKSPGKILLLPINNGIVAVGDVIFKFGTAVSLLVTAVIAPGIDKNTGNILYIDNRTSFNQTVDQAVTFRTLVRF